MARARSKRTRRAPSKLDLSRAETGQDVVRILGDAADDYADTAYEINDPGWDVIAFALRDAARKIRRKLRLERG